MNININIPASLRRHAPALKLFFEGMTFKLHVNSFKDDIDERSVQILIDRGLEELQELKDQLATNPQDPNTLSELFDMSNFNYLLFSYLRSKGVPDEREQFVNDFFTVDTATGTIYAKKTRSGSRYKEGDEISGSKRNDKTYIRIQHAANGTMISCARADIIWFAAKGEWPQQEVLHGSLGPSNDSIDNLYMRVDAKDLEKDYPFVFEREMNDQTVYGYQRRHRGVLLRVGYWGDRATAARRGVTAWKEKVEEMDDV